MRYELCLCDADGTLFDFHKGERRAFDLTMAMFSLPSGDEMANMYSRINDGHWKRFERGETTQARLRVERFADFLAAAGHGNVDADSVNKAYIENLSQQRELMAGAMDFCVKVSARMPIWIVTNGIAYVQRNRFSQCDIRQYIQGIVISEEVGTQKPDPEMIYTAVREAGLTDKLRAVMLGDSVTSDIAAAVNAQIDSILFTNGAQAPEGSGATYIVKTLSEASDIILSD